MTDRAEDLEPGTAGKPEPLNELVHDQMSRMPRRDTKPELALRRELHRRGLRFRVDYRGVPGRPDIALTRARIAVFIDGCFWHRCPLHCRMPKNNRGWWQAKLDRNVERDREKDAELTDMGWTPVHYWEHDDIDDAADEIEALWRAHPRYIDCGGVGPVCCAAGAGASLATDRE